jgi:hypothetical protein
VAGLANDETPKFSLNTEKAQNIICIKKSFTLQTKTASEWILISILILGKFVRR